MAKHQTRRPRNGRLVAVQILSAVLKNGESLSTALPTALDALEQQERALAQALSYGVLRWYHQLLAMSKLLLTKPLKERDHDVLLVLLLGLYQLKEQRVPEYAVVSESVNAVTALNKSWAKGLVNAVLRNFVRQQKQLLVALEKTPSENYSHPTWLFELIKQDWPDHWQAILAANNQQAPMVLRVNQQQQSRADYLCLLEQAGIAAQPSSVAPMAIELCKPCDVAALPGFQQGWASVQDAAPQLAAELLQAQAGERILDACAAPGGKTLHVLECQPHIDEIMAVDIDTERLARLAENAARAGEQTDKKLSIQTADMTDHASWWDGRFFDRILLDVPCSASAVIRRHPDIKVLRRATDIAALVTLQARILNEAWAMLKPGGVLLYCTCSVIRQENAEQVNAFLQKNNNACAIELDLPNAVTQDVGYQFITGEHNTDGFYYAALSKQA